MEQLKPWQYSYIIGGLMLATLRGNADATTAVSRAMSSYDYVGNNLPWRGTSANGYLHLYAEATSTVIQPVGTTNDLGHGQPTLYEDQQFGGANCFIGSSSTTWVPNTSDGHMITGNAFTLNASTVEFWNSSPSQHYVPTNGDLITAFAWQGGPTPVVPNEIPSALTQNESYYIRDLSPTGKSTGPWTFNLTPYASGPSGPAIPITDTKTGPGMFIEANYIAAHPQVDYPLGPAYMYQVANTVNWLHAIASNAKLNAIAGFT